MPNVAVETRPLPRGETAFTFFDETISNTFERRRTILESGDTFQSPWLAATHDSLANAASQLNAAWRCFEPVAALAALKRASEWQPHKSNDVLPRCEESKGQLEVAATDADVLVDGVDNSDSLPAVQDEDVKHPVAVELNAVIGIESPHEELQFSSHETHEDVKETNEIAQDNALDEKIENMLMNSGTAVRVRALDIDGDQLPNATTSEQTMAINEAVMAFDRAWHDGPVGVSNAATNASPAALSMGKSAEVAAGTIFNFFHAPHPYYLNYCHP